MHIGIHFLAGMVPRLSTLIAQIEFAKAPMVGTSASYRQEFRLRHSTNHMYLGMQPTFDALSFFAT